MLDYKKYLTNYGKGQDREKQKLISELNKSVKYKMVYILSQGLNLLMVWQDMKILQL